ncbi:hypothetical protein SALBM217S_01402 [Streptomyces griseoloalbus]
MYPRPGPLPRAPRPASAARPRRRGRRAAARARFRRRPSAAAPSAYGSPAPAYAPGSPNASRTSPACTHSPSASTSSAPPASRSPARPRSSRAPARPGPGRGQSARSAMSRSLDSGENTPVSNLLPPPASTRPSSAPARPAPSTPDTPDRPREGGPAPRPQPRHQRVPLALSNRPGSSGSRTSAHPQESSCVHASAAQAPAAGEWRHGRLERAVVVRAPGGARRADPSEASCRPSLARWVAPADVGSHRSCQLARRWAVDTLAVYAADRRRRAAQAWVLHAPRIAASGDERGPSAGRSRALGEARAATLRPPRRRRWRRSPCRTTLADPTQDGQPARATPTRRTGVAAGRVTPPPPPPSGRR